MADKPSKLLTISSKNLTSRNEESFPFSEIDLVVVEYYRKYSRGRTTTHYNSFILLKNGRRVYFDEGSSSGILFKKCSEFENAKKLASFIGVEAKEQWPEKPIDIVDLAKEIITNKNFNNVEKFRMILGNLINDGEKQDRLINLLEENLDVESAFNLKESTINAVEFLKQDKVQVKTVKPNFCHAKVYLFKDKNNNPKDCFYVAGSSNLTEAGLGIRKSSNIELNIADFGGNADFKEMLDWFKSLWKSVEAKDTIFVDGVEKSFKDYLIELLSKYFKDYNPETIYYKILYELFREDLLEYDPQSETSKQIEFLQDTYIYKCLYPFQQKGVLSLIKKIQQFNGAILADAVGLGKTYQALAVMKYFELRGYKILLFCPKKLEMNWRYYLRGHKSKFEVDKFNYTIRYHTDLQNNRLETYDDRYTIKDYFQGNPKLFIVIDESHNFRNDKGLRYKTLVDLILSEDKNKDVKVLLLTATPINTKLIDVRNQFKLIVRGKDDGFKDKNPDISSLQNLFIQAQRKFEDWSKNSNKKLSDFITNLPDEFFKLTDALIVARTRDLVKKFDAQDQLIFPEKEKPVNIYISPKNIGSIKSLDELLQRIEIKFTAYKPALYMRRKEVTSALEDEVSRQNYLAKMMYILLVKRLESSWYSFYITLKNIYNYYINALEKVNNYEKYKTDNELQLDLSEEIENELEEMSLQDDSEQFTIGKKNPIKISDIVQLKEFQEDLETDIEKLKQIIDELEAFNNEIIDEINNGEKYKSKDNKLEKLMELIISKQNSPKNDNNKKVVIFSVYKDTVKYLFEQLKSRGFKKIAFVSGDECKSDDGYSSKNFIPILERFAPYTKLYNEKDWTHLYKEYNLVPIKDYSEWLDFIKQASPDTYRMVQIQIDILIATDALSEGQNLQDCDYLINYDIHWNPVRLIQRLGRIDRLGSPNKVITGVNFWPADSYEDFLKLQE
ncbi:MAG: helicase-related protein, partial [Ignavibacteria bacterium]